MDITDYFQVYDRQIRKQCSIIALYFTAPMVFMTIAFTISMAVGYSELPTEVLLFFSLKSEPIEYIATAVFTLAWAGFGGLLIWGHVRFAKEPYLTAGDKAMLINQLTRENKNSPRDYETILRGNYPSDFSKRAYREYFLHSSQ